MFLLQVSSTDQLLKVQEQVRAELQKQIERLSESEEEHKKSIEEKSEELRQLSEEMNGLQSCMETMEEQLREAEAKISSVEKQKSEVEKAAEEAMEEALVKNRILSKPYCCVILLMLYLKIMINSDSPPGFPTGSD